MSVSSFTVLVPARLGSTRLPGKPLLDIGGLPMVVRVARQAQRCGAADVVVANGGINPRARRTVGVSITSTPYFNALLWCNASHLLQ